MQISQLTCNSEFINNKEFDRVITRLNYLFIHILEVSVCKLAQSNKSLLTISVTPSLSLLLINLRFRYQDIWENLHHTSEENSLRAEVIVVLLCKLECF